MNIVIVLKFNYQYLFIQHSDTFDNPSIEYLVCFKNMCVMVLPVLSSHAWVVVTLWWAFFFLPHDPDGDLLVFLYSQTNALWHSDAEDGD